MRSEQFVDSSIGKRLDIACVTLERASQSQLLPCGFETVRRDGYAAKVLALPTFNSPYEMNVFTGNCFRPSQVVGQASLGINLDQMRL